MNPMSELSTEQLRLLGSAVDAAEHGIAILTSVNEDKGPRIAFVNDGFCRLYGTKREAAIGQTLVAAFTLLAGALVVHAFTIAVFAACLAAVAAGFIPFNWSPARCFMGDAGSYFCGGTLAALLIIGQRSGIPLLLVGLASAPFLADAGLTLVIRLAKGNRIWQAHRSHIYQRMVSAGWSHARVATLYIAVAALAGALAVLYLARSTQ